MSSVLYKYHLREDHGGRVQNICEELGRACGKERESASQLRYTSLVLAHATVVHSPTDFSQVFSTLPEERRWQIVMKALKPTVLTPLIFYCLYLLQFVLVVGTLNKMLL